MRLTPLSVHTRACACVCARACVRLALVPYVTSSSLLGIKAFCPFQVAAKCYQKGGAFEKEKLALAHNTALNMKSKKVSPK